MSRCSGHTDICDSDKETAVTYLKAFHREIMLSGKFPKIPQISELEDLLCMCGCGSRVTNSKVACLTCRRLLSSSCKSLKNGICALCATAAPPPSKRRSAEEYDDDDFSTTADESSSTNGASIVAIVERKVRKQMEGVTSQFLLALQDQNRKLEANSRLLENYIKSQAVLHIVVLHIESYF